MLTTLNNNKIKILNKLNFMAQVKFYRGLATAYTQSATTNPTIKEGIYFSMDEKVIYHNGVKFGGIDPQYFNGVTRNFDIEGLVVNFQKLDENGEWRDVQIKLVEAADNSIVISNLTKNGVTDGFTVKVNVKDVGANDGLKLGNEGLYVDFTKTNEAINANTQAIGVLNGGATDAGSVAKSIKDAVDALNAEAVGGTGKVITTISEANGVIAATAIDLTAENVAATAIEASDETVAVEGTNVKAQVKSLAKSIKSAVSDAKSYLITSISGDEFKALGTNVKEAYKLVDEDGTQAGATIKIYKDSSLKTVELVGQELKFTYILTDGSEDTVGVDVSTFLAESEFKNGLEVVDHVVNVKIDGTSEKFLTVGADGVKVSGVQDAINKAAAKATTKVEKAADTDKITLASATAADGSVTYTIGQNNIASAALLGTATDNKDADTAFGYIAREVDARETAIKAQTNALNNEKTAREAVDGVTGNTYTAKADANYISGATSLFDADVKLNAAINAVADTAANAHTVVNAKNDGHVRVAVTNDGTHDIVTVSENDIASASALTAETSARREQDDNIEAAVGLNADGSHVQTTGYYTSTASTVVGEIAALDAALKTVSASTVWIDCGTYNPSETNIS